MGNLPSKYAWLEADRLKPLPRMVVEALAEYGVQETDGPGNTKEILGWAKQCGLEGDYNADAIPWCGLFMTAVATRAGKTPPAKPLWALNWARFGEPGGQPELGDVLVFIRAGGGHVGLYVAEDQSHYHVLGGNQSDSVCIAQIDKSRLHAVRQPPYTSKPASARTYLVAPGGNLSTAEA